MTGVVEAGTVIGLISGVISIIEATKTVYDAAKDAKGQPEAFRQVAARLPLVNEILHSAKERAETLDDSEALKPILELCKAKAENLENLFQRVVRKDDDKWYDRYKKAAGTLVKVGRVEHLMEEILKDVQVIACERMTGTATDTQMKELEEAIKEMNEMPPSLPDEAGSFIQTHSGSGDNIGHTGPGTMNIHKGTGDLYHNVISGGATFGDNQSQRRLSDPQTQNCLKDLRTTDPREDKERIEETKGGLLADSYRWILEYSDFQQWRDDKQSRLLWIKGDPGKGKTMLLCGIVNEMSPLTKLRDQEATTLLSYFFCQATDRRINNAAAVLRGLIYLLVDQQPSLVSHVRKKYDHGVERPFEGVNGWVALSTVFENILQDPSLKSTYLIVDALDECETDLPQLLKLVAKSASTFPLVKWILSSRNKPDIEAWLRLNNAQMILSLELNSEHVSRAVELFIDYKVSQLPLIMDDSALQETVRHQIYAKAGGTFLWAALALKQLDSIESWDVLDVLQEMPPELEPLYHRMLRQVQQLQRKDPEFCRLVLSTMTLAYRPLHLLEVGALSSLPKQISSNLDNITRVINKCGSFLTIREGIIYFVHQSAKDYLLENASNEIFLSGKEEAHYVIFSRSLQVMSRTLQRDVYRLGSPGSSIDQIKRPDPDPLVAVQYSCLYWIDHLLDCDIRHTTNDLKDGGSIDRFLCQNFLHWLEALSLMKSLSSGIVMIRKLENQLKADDCLDLCAFVYDSKRFALSNRSVIEQAPLQLYCSALVFAPEKSNVRTRFEKCVPPWIQTKPNVQANWDASLQILEGHTDPVISVKFSHDSKLLASASYDNTVIVWDTATGLLLQSLKGHTSTVSSVVFSHDSKLLASASYDSTIRVWDTITGSLQRTLNSHTGGVWSVAFSHDSKQLASASSDKTVRVWDTLTGLLQQILRGHTGAVSSVVFSHDSKLLASASSDCTIRVWDTTKGLVQQILKGHTSTVSSVVFSHDSNLLASASYDHTVRVWNTTTGSLQQTPKGYRNTVWSVKFSHNSKLLASASDKTVSVLNAATGSLQQMLKGHTDTVCSVAFSHDSKLLASASSDSTVRIWDATIGSQQTLEDHIDDIHSLVFSQDSKLLASPSYHNTIRIWDASTGLLRQTLAGHTDWVHLVAFSYNSKLLASAAHDNTVRVWDTTTGSLQQTLKGHTNTIVSVAFSYDSKLLASAWKNFTVRIWDTATGLQQQTLKGHTNSVMSLAFSYNSKLLASASYDSTVRVWDATTGLLKQTLKGHTDSVKLVAFSHDSKLLASASDDHTVKIWDIAEGSCHQTILVNDDSILSLSFDSIDMSLVTNVGYIKVDRIGLYLSPESSQLRGSKGDRQGLGIIESWVTWNSENLLWLPPSYRPGVSNISPSGFTVAIGCKSRRLIMIGFSSASLSTLR